MSAHAGARPRRVRRAHRTFGAVLAALGALALLGGGVLTVTRATAVLQDVAETGAPGLLMLRSDPGDPVWQDLAPGDAVHWVVQARLEGAPASTLALQLRSDGGLVLLGELTVGVVSCTDPFHVAPDPQDPPVCGGTIAEVVPQQPLAQVASSVHSDTYELAPLEEHRPRYLLVTLGIPAHVDPGDVADGSARVGVGLFASGPDLPANDGLAVTGSDAAAIGLVACGVAGLAAGLTLTRRGAGRRGAGPCGVDPRGFARPCDEGAVP